MFCPKCGTQNPETGRFCRTCGADLGNVSEALAGNLPKNQNLVGKKEKPVNYEQAVTKIFTGLAFLIVAAVLGITGVAGGKFWWFWMLVPAFGSLGSGIAQYVQLKKTEQQRVSFTSPASSNFIAPAPPNTALPPTKTEYIAPDSRYKTGELVPPSVVEGTTRHLEINHEGETMTLPKKN